MIGSVNVKSIQRSTVQRHIARLHVAGKNDFDGIKRDSEGNLPGGYVSNYKKAFEIWERKLLTAYLWKHGGNQCAAAKELGIHRNTFSRALLRCGFTDSELQEFRNSVKI